MGASIARKLARLGPRVLRHQLAQVCSSSCLVTCFSCAAIISILKACSYIFLPYMCLRKSRYLKFRRARPQCVVLHTLVLMYSCRKQGEVRAERVRVTSNDPFEAFMAASTCPTLRQVAPPTPATIPQNLGLASPQSGRGGRNTHQPFPRVSFLAITHIRIRSSPHLDGAPNAVAPKR